MGINPIYLHTYLRGNATPPSLVYPIQTPPSPTPTSRLTFRKVWRTLEFRGVGKNCRHIVSYIQVWKMEFGLKSRLQHSQKKLYTYRELQTGMENGVRIKIQTQTHWNLNGRTMTALPPGLSPSSILPPNFAQFRPQSDNAKFGASRKLHFFVCLLFKKKN